jgi:hypothetical protein
MLSQFRLALPAPMSDPQYGMPATPQQAVAALLTEARPAARRESAAGSRRRCRLPARSR